LDNLLHEPDNIRARSLSSHIGLNEIDTLWIFSPTLTLYSLLDDIRGLGDEVIYIIMLCHWNLRLDE
jgi:hypothetical protein